MEIRELIPEYLNYLKTIGRSELTVKKMGYYLGRFLRYLEAEGISQPAGLKAEVILSYQEELCWQITRQGDLLKKSTQFLALVIVKGFCRWLVEADYLVSDPAKNIRLPKLPQSLPRDILEVREAKRLITRPDTRTVRGYRDRLVLELLYSSGIRRRECSNLKVEDVDYKDGYLRINSGKGDKDRVVPLGKIASELCENYIKVIRPELIERWGDGKDDGYLILNRWGKKIDPMGIYMIVKKYARISRQKKNVSPHTFRRSCTTHMLRRGANIRHLQEMLGHSNINSTQIYLKLSINDLKKAHAKYHPRERKQGAGEEC